MFAVSSSVTAADGEKLYAEHGCAACHGPTGNEPIVATYPKIAGQNRKYLIRQMNDIKSGARDNGQSVAMGALMVDVGEDDIVAIAEYLSNL